MTLYYAPSYQRCYGNELYHYGVPGMKWGERKAQYYTNKANRYTGKVSTSRTRLGKNYNNLQAHTYDVYARQQKRKNKSKGLGKVIGSGYAADTYNAASDYYNRKAGYSKTRLGKTINEARSYNAKTTANVYTKVSNTKGAVNKVKTYMKESWNRPVKTIAGRKTTAGKQYIDHMLGISTAKDIEYAVKQRNAAKATYKQAKNDAYAKYEKAIAGVEKSYKKGQTLSAKDQAREAKIEADYYDELRRAKTAYKNR